MSENVLEFWDRLVEEAPKSAVLFWPDGRVVSRQEIDEKADALSKNLRTEGLKPHRLLLLQLPNGIDWIVSFLACLKLRVIVIPIDQSIEREEVLSLLEDLKAQGLWDGNVLQKAEITKVRQLRNKKIVVGKLTSGSTGNPKILFFSDREMIADGKNIIRAMRISKNDINLGLIPWGHSYGLGSIIYPLLIQGTGTTWVDAPFPRDIADACERVKATIFPAVPTVLRALGRSGCEREKLSSLRLVISAGARLAPEVVHCFRDAYGIVPKNFYGSTETGGICFDETGEAALSGRSVGKPIGGVRIQETRGKRFYVESEAVYSFGNKKAGKGLVSKHLVADYGYIDARGELVLEKRAKGIVKVGGKRINPAEIESRLEELELVREAIVFGLDLEEETVLAAAVESSASRATLLEVIRNELPRRLRPKKLICFESFPATRTGKVSLGEIKKAFD